MEGEPETGDQAAVPPEPHREESQAITSSHYCVMADKKVVYEGHDDREAWAAIVKAAREGAYYVTCSINGVETFRSKAIDKNNAYWRRRESF